MKKQSSQGQDALVKHFDEKMSLNTESTCADSNFNFTEDQEEPSFDWMSFARLICNPKHNLFNNTLLDDNCPIISALKETESVPTNDK